MPSTSAVLLRKLRQFLDEDESDHPIVVGYSGGRDSAVLLWCLVQLVDPVQVRAVHVDHGWRSEEERLAEARTVETWCHTLGVRLIRFPPPSTETVKTEMAARNHRLACFRTVLEEGPARLFLAHHQDDQAETILMRLLRGHSWMGLGGMQARRGPFRRPFLDVRSQLLAQCAEEQAIPFHEDTTNSDVRWTRNFLRREVFPGISNRFPRAVESLADFGRVWNLAEPSRQPAADWQATPGGFSVSLAVWDRWTPWERQAQLLACVNASGVPSSLTHRFLETICSTGRRGRALAGGWTWTRAQTVVWARMNASIGGHFVIEVVPGRRYEVNGYHLCWEEDGPHSLYIDAVNPHEAWVWRSVEPGMVWSSADDADWGRDLRRRRMGGLGLGSLALVVQRGLIRAIVEPGQRRLIWAESGDGKLHKTGIFVTLIDVTPNATE